MIPVFLAAACSSSGPGHAAGPSSSAVASGSASSSSVPASPAAASSLSSPSSPTSPAKSASPPASAGAEAGLGGCPVAPADDIWRTRVDTLPVAADSAVVVASIGTAKKVHADFGSGMWNGGPIGIPVTLAPRGTAKVRVTFEYADESDKGPYPIPADAQVEGGPQADGDRHVLVVDPATCTDYELYSARRNADGSWSAGSGAVFDLRSDLLRPAGWTSADAAGLPILPGLARYDEASTGTIDHALRITVPKSRSQYVWPARHEAGDSGAALPPMGLRVRLKASIDISGLPPQARAVAQALKTYGAIVADNGSAWYVSGAPDDRWDNDQLQRLGMLVGGDFEVVDVSGLEISPGSGAARQP